MTETRCRAQLKLDKPGEYAICDRFVESHFTLDHKDFTKQVDWPCCSKYCLKDHVHGRYRLKLGTPTGPSTAAARGPKADRPVKPARQCSICLQPEVITEVQVPRSRTSNLEHGRCKDQAACAERAPQLELGV